MESELTQGGEKGCIQRRECQDLLRNKGDVTGELGGAKERVGITVPPSERRSGQKIAERKVIRGKKNLGEKHSIQHQKLPKYGTTKNRHIKTTEYLVQHGGCQETRT